MVENRQIVQAEGGIDKADLRTQRFEIGIEPR